VTQVELLTALGIDPATPMNGTAGQLFALAPCPLAHVISCLGEPADIEVAPGARIVLTYEVAEGIVLITGQRDDSGLLTGGLVFLTR
jgi:hypothetical protein